MAERSNSEGFLEKMLGPLPGEPQPDQVRWVGDAVRNHLAILFNTRRGSVPNLPDYGMPEVSTYYSEYPASLVGLRSLLRELIEKYEPRLRNVRVRLLESDDSEFKVAFEISGELPAEEDDGTAVKYRTTISSSGYTDLQ